MSERETSDAINSAAAAWVARLDTGADAAVRAELDAWLAADERRGGAYFRAQAAWTMLDRACVLRGSLDVQPAEDIETERPRFSRRTVMFGGGMIAASVAAAAVGIGQLRQSTERIETAVGEIRRVPLKDGSFAAVNTNTRLAVTLKRESREVQLDSGEAWFEVAKDADRPFVVAAGDVRVRAVGTAFAVRRTGDGADVQVTEGVVEVWSKSDPTNVRRLSAGTAAFASNTAGPSLPADTGPDLDRTLAWRNGQLMFDGETLEAAAAEFNRYNMIQVEIADPALAQEKMVGRFRTNEPDAFARAAATVLGASAREEGNKIVLTRD
jgi:transmembrane sensor